MKTYPILLFLFVVISGHAIAQRNPETVPLKENDFHFGMSLAVSKQYTLLWHPRTDILFFDIYKNNKVFSIGVAASGKFEDQHLIDSSVSSDNNFGFAFSYKIFRGGNHKRITPFWMGDITYKYSTMRTYIHTNTQSYARATNDHDYLLNLAYGMYYRMTSHIKAECAGGLGALFNQSIVYYGVNPVNKGVHNHISPGIFVRVGIGYTF